MRTPSEIFLVQSRIANYLSSLEPHFSHHQDQEHEIGQSENFCYYWREHGDPALKKCRWKGPAILAMIGPQNCGLHNSTTHSFDCAGHVSSSLCSCGAVARTSRGTNQPGSVAFQPHLELSPLLCNCFKKKFKTCVDESKFRMSLDTKVPLTVSWIRCVRQQQQHNFVRHRIRDVAFVEQHPSLHALFPPLRVMLMLTQPLRLRTKPRETAQR